MKKSVQPLTTILSGRAEAVQSADIRPRIGGVIKEVSFKEGGFVKAGDLLYKIDDATYVAAVEEVHLVVDPDARTGDGDQSEDHDADATHHRQRDGVDQRAELGREAQQDGEQAGDHEQGGRVDARRGHHAGGVE